MMYRYLLKKQPVSVSNILLSSSAETYIEWRDVRFVHTTCICNNVCSLHVWWKSSCSKRSSGLPAETKLCTGGVHLIKLTLWEEGPNNMRSALSLYHITLSIIASDHLLCSALVLHPCTRNGDGVIRTMARRQYYLIQWSYNPSTRM